MGKMEWEFPVTLKDAEGGTNRQTKKQGGNSRQCLCWKSERKLVL